MWTVGVAAQPVDHGLDSLILVAAQTVVGAGEGVQVAKGRVTAAWRAAS